MKEKGFVLFAVLLIMTGIAVIYLGMFAELEIFKKLNNRMKMSHTAWDYAQNPPDINQLNLSQASPDSPMSSAMGSSIIYSNREIMNSQNIPWRLAWKQAPWRENYLVQLFPKGEKQVTWELGTAEKPGMIIRQVWIMNGQRGKIRTLVG